MTVHHVYLDRLVRAGERAAFFLASHIPRLGPARRRLTGKVWRWVARSRPRSVILRLRLRKARERVYWHIRLRIV